MSSSNPSIKRVRQQLKKHEVQIVLTEINTEQPTAPQLLRSSFQLDEEHYFYPASTAKLPIAALTLQKLNELNTQGIPIKPTTAFEIRDLQGKGDSANRHHPKGRKTDPCPFDKKDIFSQ
jgi:hypothetical protein